MSNHGRIFMHDKDLDKFVSGHGPFLVFEINEKKKDAILSRDRIEFKCVLFLQICRESI